MYKLECFFIFIVICNFIIWVWLKLRVYFDGIIIVIILVGVEIVVLVKLVFLWS